MIQASFFFLEILGKHSLSHLKLNNLIITVLSSASGLENYLEEEDLG